MSFSVSSASLFLGDLPLAGTGEGPCMALIELPQGRRHPSRPNTEPRSASVKLRLQFVPSGAYPINTRGGPVLET